MLPGNLTKLFEQICWDIGYDTSNLPAYLSGEFIPTFIDAYPEMVHYRDVVFTFKYMMGPSAEALPEVKSWMPIDARLTWRYKEGQYAVLGFGRGMNNSFCSWFSPSIWTDII
jgi:hypothetical protein